MPDFRKQSKEELVKKVSAAYKLQLAIQIERAAMMNKSQAVQKLKHEIRLHSDRVQKLRVAQENLFTNGGPVT